MKYNKHGAFKKFSRVGGPSARSIDQLVLDENPVTGARFDFLPETFEPEKHGQVCLSLGWHGGVRWAVLSQQYALSHCSSITARAAWRDEVGRTGRWRRGAPTRTSPASPRSARRWSQGRHCHSALPLAVSACHSTD
jgi:hypothetical protein